MLIAILIAAFLVLYFIPSIVAVSRVHGNIGAIFALNLFLGWTLVFWVMALVWALYKTSRRVVYGAPYKLPERLSPDELAQRKAVRETLPHCMAHERHWPACYACNLRAYGLSDHEPVDFERRS